MHELAESRLIGRWPRTALTFTAVTVVAYFLACAAATLMVEPRLPELNMTGSGNGKAATKVSVPPLKFFAPIWGRNAFKAARPQPKKPKPVNKSLDKLAVATIPARLLGTMYSDVPVFSRAVILTNNKQKLVKIGDTLSGFKVEEIRRRAIVLVKGRQRQLLLIDKHDKKIASKKGESRKMISRSEIKKKLQNLDALAKDISVAPATRGKQKGLWVRQLRQGSLFSKAGLEKDDVVLKIGGEPVVGGVNPLGFFKMLDRDQVVVDVLRRGKPMQLVLILSR